VNLGLSGHAAVVTGGASGIGAAVAVELAREGCDVAIVDRQADGAAAAVVAAVEATGRQALLLPADVRDAGRAGEVVAAVLARFGRLDALVCSAGITADALLWKMTDEQWDSVIDVNLKGCFVYNRAVAPGMRDRRAGSIVNVASINGLRGKFSQANYAASKGGMIAFSKSVARELGKFNVTVNVLAPGMIGTPMMQALPAPVIEAAIDETATGRLGTPEDCAAVVAFLCSARARHVTGAVVQVDGGQYL
jgi:3-oxoacyl-[acyl-carrier protein] reductase